MQMSDWAHLKTELYWLYQGAVLPSYRQLQEINYPGQSAYFIHKGSVEIETKAGMLTAKTGQWVVPSIQMFRRDFSEDAEVLSMRFACDWPDGRPGFDSEIAFIFEDTDLPELRTLANALEVTIMKVLPEPNRRLRIARGSLGDYLQIREKFIAWLTLLVQFGQSKNAFFEHIASVDERILEVARLLDRHPLDKRLNDDILQSAANLSATQLNRLFHKHFEVTPHQYLDRRRYQQAIYSLRSTKAPVKQIAYELGFSTSSYFSRWFQLKSNETPKQFRQNHSAE